MTKRTKFLVSFEVPIEVEIQEKASLEEVRTALSVTALERLNKKTYKPTIEVVYDTVPKDETQQNKVLGHPDQRSQVNSDLGTSERKNTDHDKSLQGNELGESQRNQPGKASIVGDGSTNSKET